MSVEEEVGEEKGTEEVPEALEEAPPGFVVDVDGLEAMIKISDLLYEAARSEDPAKYIEEIEKLSSSIAATKEKRRRVRRAVAAKAPKKGGRAKKKPSESK